MKITHVGAVDAFEIEIGAGRTVVVKRGETVDVPAAVAGRPPEARVAACEAELVAAVAAIDHDKARALREEWVSLDHGAGLLAQPANWQPAKGKSKEDSD